jgi:hypothetical protein
MVQSQSVVIAILEKSILWYDNPFMCWLMTSSLESRSRRLSLEIGSHAMNLSAVMQQCHGGSKLNCLRGSSICHRQPVFVIMGGPIRT